MKRFNQIKMNINILAYITYSLLSAYITIYVGWVLYSNGKHYIFQIFEEWPISNFINKMLLTGYYLVNLGIVLYKVSVWEHCSSGSMLVENVLHNLADILMILTFLYFTNIVKVYVFHKKLRKIFSHV